MTVKQSDLLAELRTDFESLLNLVTGAEAQTATVNQMERSLLHQLLRMGRKLLQVFLVHRAEGESHAPQWGWQGRSSAIIRRRAWTTCRSLANWK